MSDEATVHQVLSKDCPIHNVTVYTSTAAVTRVITKELTPGAHNIVLGDLPVGVLDNSVRVNGTGKATILEISDRKKFVPIEDNSSAIEKLREEAEQAEEAVKSLQTKKENLGKEAALFSDLTDNMISTGNTDFQSMISESSLKSFSSFLEFNYDNSKRFDEDGHALDKEISAMQTKITKMKSQLAAYGSGRRDERRTEVTVSLQVHSDTEIKLEITYMINGAGWSPSYDVRVDSNEGKLQMSYFAHIKQSTGEDWDDAYLALSTAQPSLSSSPPDLEFLYLNYHYNAYPSPSRRQDLDMFTNCEYNSIPLPAPGPPPPGAVMRSASSALKPKMPTVTAYAANSGGNKLAASLYHIPAKQPSLPSDNAPHKVTISVLELPTEFSHFAVPKLDTKTYLKSSTTNNTEFILLEGTVSVFFDNTFVSNSTLKTVCPSEQFELFLGTDPGVDINYKPPHQKHDTVGLIKTSNRTTVTKSTVVTNNKAIPVTISLVDHIPRTSDNRIKVNLDVPYGLNPDEPLKNVSLENGNKALEVTLESAKQHITWKIEVPSQGKVTVPLVYSVEYPKTNKITSVV